MPGDDEIPQQGPRTPRGRVVIIGTRGYPSYYGGFETLVRRLAPHLVDEGWEVTVYGRAGSTRPDDPERDARIATVDTPGRESRSLSTLSYGLTSSLHAARTRPDVALVMNVANGYWLPLLKARGIPTVVNVDGIEWDRDKWGRLARSVFRGGARATARFADVLVYDAEAIRDRWVRDFGRDGVVIPYGGQPPGDLPLLDGLRHRGYALMVARLVPENTVPQFLEAASEMSRVADVVVVGTSGYGGELDARVAALAAGNQRIRWLGHVSDDRTLFSLWQHAGAYFHGHSVGGTNPGLVQAMACGAPVVARDTVFNREVLDDAGVFVGPTPTDIRDGMLATLSDPSLQDKLSQAALARAQAHYRWPDINQAYGRTLIDACRSSEVAS
ncbi:glycosyltransferase [Geodermatophilus sp. CPCC 205761]|uniref:glycosyltransferase n=1 Tax=Geodermatophilus sp. CPCC 205761 TaxID=2936597 RepID=UPI003EF03BCA